MSGFHLAYEQGYFSDAGLDVEIQRISDSSYAIPLLAGSELDVAFIALSPGFPNAVSKGAVVRIAAGQEIASAACGAIGTVYGNKAAFPQGLTDLKALKGKRVAIPRKAGLAEYFLDLLLTAEGMSSDQLTLTYLPEPEAAAVLIEGKIDAMLGFHLEKNLDDVSDSVIRGISIADVFSDLPTSFVVFGPSLLRHDRKTGVSFLAAYLKGVKEFVGGKTPRFLEDLAKERGMDTQLVHQACRDTFAADGQVDRTSVQRYIDWAASKGYCAPGMDAANLIDDSFLREVRGKFRHVLNRTEA